MYAKLSAISVSLIVAIALWSGPALSEDDMMSQMNSAKVDTTAVAKKHSTGAHKKSSAAAQMGSGGMGNMPGMTGQTGSGGNQMGGMGDMHGMMGQMGSDGNQMGGMGNMPGMTGQTGSGGNQMGGMGDMMGQMGSGGKQMGGMGDMHGMMGQMGSGGNQMSGVGQMGSGNQQNATGSQATTGLSDMSEHAKHHPGGGGGMGDMMAPAPSSSSTQTTTILPAPQGSLEDQVKIQELANNRMEDGTSLMTQGIVSLSSAKQKNDVRSMDQATRQIRHGLSQFESGLSAQRALSDGVAPREIGLRWFKQQMNLSTTPADHGGDIFGVSWFHFFVMAALIVFAVVMIGMYFFKIRRAAEVLGRVSQPATPDKEKPRPETSASKP